MGTAILRLAVLKIGRTLGARRAISVVAGETKKGPAHALDYLRNSLS